MIPQYSAFIAAALAVSVTLAPWVAAWSAESAPAEQPAEKPGEGTNVEGAGYSLFDTESIKGFDESKVQKDPVCDRSKRPRILKVEPDEVKPGDKVVIKGENFGTKECIQSVTFSSAAGAKVDYKYINESTIEATVPDGRAGMSFVIVVAGSGSAQSKPVLIKSK
ncbi:IPT/TIG domain-containing protein [Nitrospira sp. Kam-Ns4a]